MLPGIPHILAMFQKLDEEEQPHGTEAKAYPAQVDSPVRGSYAQDGAEDGEARGPDGCIETECSPEREI